MTNSLRPTRLAVEGAEVTLDVIQMSRKMDPATTGVGPVDWARHLHGLDIQERAARAIINRSKFTVIE